MRKLLHVLAFTIAYSATVGALVPQASAQRFCPDPQSKPTIETLQKTQQSCRSNCDEVYKKKPTEIPGCKLSCDHTYEDCKAKLPSKPADPPPSHATLACSKDDVSVKHINTVRNNCAAKCDKTTASPGWISDCKKACDTTRDFCMQKFEAWDKKRVECAKPTRTCIDQCPHGDDAFNKCFNECANKNAEPVMACSRRAMDWPSGD